MAPGSDSRGYGTEASLRTSIVRFAYKPTMPQFIPGLQLSRSFFEQVIQPIIHHVTPDVEYAAALIGSGSEVLGFDDAMSADHHWGPRVMLFLKDEEIVRVRDLINETLREQLPPRFLGFPTNFSEPDANDNNVQKLVAVNTGPINHRVDIFTIRDYLLAYLNFDIDREIEPADWLTFPEQKLRSITADTIFHDEIGLKSVLLRFSYYPNDIWLYLLASGWNRIGQEEHLMGRAGLAGDEIGSALIAARLVRDIMRLCFLMERKYAPYPKWFGTAFRSLECADEISPHLEAVLRAATWQKCEENLVPAYEQIAAMHNELGITDRLPAKCAEFFGRPFKVIELTGGFAKAIAEQISDPEVKRIASKGLIGGVDQFSDSTDVLSDTKRRITFRKLYD
jgi:hypothetical protein